ncbi:epimerase [Rahnella aquatilis]|uniref:Epimerase n=1 Tax=Rahnella perminowiae TaxID=2816244 RepID=A0ABS6L145_9GAMM|nr:MULTISPECIES: epimerase [Rahnella]MBU9835550.1 epimerase [Rahnella perminowiae]MCR9001852.1 epimerase [Rahnella perminowiae]UJD89056.1 epimerase [Rahnella aquatilis]
MRVLIYGASGMVGQGVLRECMKAKDVETVTVIVRSPLPECHTRLNQVVTDDLISPLAGLNAAGKWDACFFCLGVSASGLSEEEYSRITFKLTLDVASDLVRLDPDITFIYVSGAGTDSSEAGKSMWARVKGKTENSLLRLGFTSAQMFRPAVIWPLDDIRSKTTVYRIFYTILSPFFPALKRLFPNSIITTEEMGKAMLNAVRYGYGKSVLGKEDICLLAKK